MGMNKQLVSLAIIALILPLYLCGCTENAYNQSDIEKTVLGSWQDRDTTWRTYTFYANGTCILNGNVIGSYQITNESLFVNYSGRQDIFEYFFSEDGTMMRLTNTVDGYIRMYNRK